MPSFFVNDLSLEVKAASNMRNFQHKFHFCIGNVNISHIYCHIYRSAVETLTMCDEKASVNPPHMQLDPD